MNLSEIQALIKFVSKSGASEVELETKDFKIIIKTPSSKKKGATEPEQTIIQTQVPVPTIQQVHAMPQVVSPTPAAVPAAEPAPAAAPAPPAPAASDDGDNSNYVTIKSPMIGTFYRASSPDADAFASVGDTIAPGKVICIIEAMKLFNEIESEISGKIVKVLADDQTPVEYDQPLFLVDPS